MEDLVSPPCQKQNTRRCTPRAKDIWLAVRDGSVHDVDAALSLLKKNGGNINARNLFGLTPLHIATWRNHAPIVRRLLEAGADPDARDGESGWSSLHRALHFGHLAIANILLQSGASLVLEDSKRRTTVDLLSGPVLQAIGKDSSSMATEVFSWGSGVNYQLGTGNAHIQKLPCKVDSLHGSFIKLISAAKFHSIAVTARGEVYTWGFGRGGRLGHPDFDIHSGQAAIITPRLVTSGLGARRVKAVAAAKHHTAVVTEGGEVFTWGSNREGQLGYTSVDTQPTPRRVSSLKTRITAVAAANKHTAVVSEAGEIYTWGCNKEGQLGYGTSNSASNYTPRVVEYLKGKFFVSVSAAKYHTVALGSDGEVFTWGHRLVTPRRVIVARNIKKFGNPVLKFHRAGRLNVISVAAGMKHSLALTDDGALFYWASSDPDLQCHQLYALCGRSIVSVSAGKYWTAAVSATGDVYTWDAKKGNSEPPTFGRLHGVKKATSVAVGETHLLVLSTLYQPRYEPRIEGNTQKLKENEELDELNEGFMFDDFEKNVFYDSLKEDIARCTKPPGLRNSSEESNVPSLKSLCEKAAAEHLVEPRNAIQLLEIADSLVADDLKKHCEEITLRNLDYILTVSSHAFLGTSLDILVQLEKLLDLKSSEPWSCRRLPTPTAPFPVIIESEEEDRDYELRRIRNHGTETLTFTKGDGFLQSNDGGIGGVSKQIRALRKKLQQVEMLEDKQTKGHLLDNQQIAKLQMRSELETALAELGVPSEKISTEAVPADERMSKRGGSRKQRRKNKERDSRKGEESTDFAPESESGIPEVSADVKVPEEINTGKIADIESPAAKDPPLSKTEERVEENPQNKTAALPAKSKKKSRKGGLSMFLSGALDEVPKQPTPPPTVKPKTDAPAWGGAKVSKELTSLRYIQDEQSKTKESPEPARTKEISVDSPWEAFNTGKVPLGSFLCSSPKPMVSNRKPQVSDGDKHTPPWAAGSGTPPSLSRPSLRDIQLQQNAATFRGKHQGVSHSPSSRTTGFSVSPGHGSPSEPAGVINRWFKPEAEAASSIRSIQIEEKAMKDLRRFYSSVRIVSNHQQP